MLHESSSIKSNVDGSENNDTVPNDNGYVSDSGQINLMNNKKT